MKFDKAKGWGVECIQTQSCPEEFKLQTPSPFSGRNEAEEGANFQISTMGEPQTGTRETAEGSLEDPTLTKVSQRLAGPLSAFIREWQEITSNPVVLSWIEGYKIPFNSHPFQLNIPGHKTVSKSEEQFIQEEINRLLKLKAIQKCSSLPGEFISSFFLANKTNRGKTFYFELKTLELFCICSAFQNGRHENGVTFDFSRLLWCHY